MLEDMGHQVHMETSGAHALNTFTNNPGGFDLIITDLGMPDISGLRLAEMLLKVRANIPILLLTGLEGQAQSRARESGIHLFGIKPLSITETCRDSEKRPDRDSVEPNQRQKSGDNETPQQPSPPC